MATIVTIQGETGQYILLGAGFGAYQSARPSVFLGNLAPSKEAGELPVVLVCDYTGRVAWVESADVEVVSVDGLSPADVLACPG